MGIDTATRKELIGANKTVAEICDRISADSLAYLSLDGMVEAVTNGVRQQTGHCAACFSGEYPIPIPDWLFSDEREQEKLIFEDMWG